MESKLLKAIFLVLLALAIGFIPFSLASLNGSILPCLFILTAGLTVLSGFSAFYLKKEVYLKPLFVFGVLSSSALLMISAQFLTFAIIFIAFLLLLFLNHDKFFSSKGLLAHSLLILIIGIVLSAYTSPSFELPFYLAIITTFVGLFSYDLIKPEDIKGYLKFFTPILFSGVLLALLFPILENPLAFLTLGLLPVILVIYLVYKLYTAAEKEFSLKRALIAMAVILVLMLIFYPRNIGYYYSVSPRPGPTRACDCMGIKYSVPSGCTAMISPLFGYCTPGGLGLREVKCAGIPYNCRRIPSEQNS